MRRADHEQYDMIIYLRVSWKRTTDPFYTKRSVDWWE